jgi:outer membrane protein TolC
MRRWSAACALIPLLVPAATAAEPVPLQPGEVLRSVEQHYPLLRAVEADRRAAAAELRSKRGRFDPRLVSGGDLRPIGFYESFTGDAGLEQPTTLWGARLYAGYRLGRGDFASYDGGRKTNGAGEVRGGLELPLLRGGPIDSPRAELEQARLGLRRIDPEIELQRIDFQRQALLSYWSWVAAGLGVGVGERLLGVAEERGEQLQGRVSRGLLPRIDLVDNERLIVERQIRLRGAERDAQQAAIELSLFLRDAAGDPVIADPGRLPRDFPPEDEPSAAQMLRDVEQAQQAHPLLQSLLLEIEQTRVELRLARNESLPSVDLKLEGSQDLGESSAGIDTVGKLSSDPRGETEMKALIRFELPLLRREALGRAQAVEARLDRLESQQRITRDRIAARIRTAMAALRAAYAQTLAARRNVELADELQRAEQRKLTLGRSNLIDVNIRELQAADADRALIETQAAYFRALAEYRAAVAHPSDSLFDSSSSSRSRSRSPSTTPNT